MAEMRLIDANALKKHLGIDGDRKYINKIAHETSDYIDEMPTIDAVPVVRCRDCKEYEQDCGYCDYWEVDRNFDDYCSRGVRKMVGGAADG